MNKCLVASLLLTGAVGCVLGGDKNEDGTEDSGPAPSAEFGPENRWFHALNEDVPEGLEGTGYLEGDVAYDWTLTDQFGDDVQLYQFYGKPVQLVLVATWAEPCREEAEIVSSTVANLGEEVVVVSVIMENQEGEAPSVEDLSEWAATYGTDHPVVAGPAHLAAFITIGFPTNPILGADMTVVNEDNYPFTEATLQSHL